MSGNNIKFNHIEIFKTTLSYVYITTHVALWIFTVITVSNSY